MVIRDRAALVNKVANGKLDRNAMLYKQNLTAKLSAGITTKRQERAKKAKKKAIALKENDEAIINKLGKVQLEE